MGADLTVRLERELDFEATARLANEAFGVIGEAFTPQRLEWLYDRAFNGGTTVLGLFAAAEKVGQVVLLGQPFAVDGQMTEAVALVDLFILPAFRSREAIATLYGQVETFCREQGIRVILAVPNAKAQGVNRRFLNLDTAATLDIRAGVAMPSRAKEVTTSVAIGAQGRDAEIALLRPFEQQRGTALRWTADGLWDRLQDPSTRYAVHATADLLLITAAKTRRHIPMTLLCGLLTRKAARPKPREVRQLVAAACRFHGRPFFVYIGRNAFASPPGWAVPARLRPSVMIVQARDLTDATRAFALDRFELIDFDFA